MSTPLPTAEPARSHGTASPGETPEPGVVLTLGLGITVAMWFVGYLGHLPFVVAVLERLPFAVATGAVSLAGFVLCLVGGGVLAGRWSARGVWTGLRAGALAAVVDLLVLGSVLAQAGAPPAAIWIPGFIGAATALAGLGAWVGRLSRGSAIPPGGSWSGGLTRVAVAATLLLLLAGGLVTSHDAGLAVPDWPNTYRSNMFLYPLSRMTGGIYYEHTHRLFGALVGLTTILVAGHLWWRERRRWLGRLALVAVPAVVLQGVLGGLRVTGRFTLETEGLDPRIELAVVHGVLAQLFFAFLVALAAFASRTWRDGPAPRPHPQAGADRALTSWLAGLVALQLVLGALVRHVELGVVWHIVVALAVVAVGVAAGVRSWGLYPDRPVLPRLGLALVALLCVQLALGLGSLVTTHAPGAVRRPPLEVPFTVAHQSLGAVILAATVQLRLWQQRLLTPADGDRDAKG